MLNTLIESDFIKHYNIKPTTLTANEFSTSRSEFDLIDNQANNPIREEGKEGYVTLRQNYGQVDILLYDEFYKNIKGPKSIKENIKHCDFVLTSPKDECVCLIELTSAEGSTEGLSKPIRNKKTEKVIFSNGKYEKAEVQLCDSLKMLMGVPAIKNDFDSRGRKVCLMAYRIIPYMPKEQLKHPYNRYQRIEAKLTGGNGAVISCPQIEEYGFEYRRIEHHYAFTL